jgi:kynurenine formamidase
MPVLAITLLIPVSYKAAPSSELIAEGILEQGKIVDLSYTFNADTIYWLTGKPFKLEKVPGTWTVAEQGYWYASKDYGPTNEHGGTHVDAPIHFSAHGRTIEEIPLEEWIGSAIVIDVSQKCTKNPDYLLNIDDIKEWEKEYGEIPKGAWVVMNSGWGKYWPDKARYLGTDLTGIEAIPYLHFPGFSPKA